MAVNLPAAAGHMLVVGIDALVHGDGVVRGNPGEGKPEQEQEQDGEQAKSGAPDRKSTRLNSSHLGISYAVFCLKKKNITPRFGRWTSHGQLCAFFRPLYPV